MRKFKAVDAVCIMVLAGIDMYPLYWTTSSEGIFVTFYYIHVHFWKKNVPWHIHGLSDFSFNKIFAVLYI